MQCRKIFNNYPKLSAVQAGAAVQAVWQAARLFETWQTKLTNKQTNKQTSKQNKQANKQTKNKHSAASCLSGSKAVRNLMPPKMQQTNITTIKQIRN